MAFLSGALVSGRVLRAERTGWSGSGVGLSAGIAVPAVVTGTVTAFGRFRHAGRA